MISLYIFIAIISATSFDVGRAVQQMEQQEQVNATHGD